MDCPRFSALREVLASDVAVESFVKSLVRTDHEEFDFAICSFSVRQTVMHPGASEGEDVDLVREGFFDSADERVFQDGRKVLIFNFCLNGTWQPFEVFLISVGRNERRSGGLGGLKMLDCAPSEIQVRAFRGGFQHRSDGLQIGEVSGGSSKGGCLKDGLNVSGLGSKNGMEKSALNAGGVGFQMSALNPWLQLAKALLNPRDDTVGTGWGRMRGDRLKG